MINISIITVFPEIFTPFLKLSLIGRAVEKGLVSFNLVRFSDFCAPLERIDEPTAGPGAGMILKPEVVEKAINFCQERWGNGHKIFFSPQGKTLNQNVLKEIAQKVLAQGPDVSTHATENSAHIILVCPRYEGMDARVEASYADSIISIGDYVLMGGDLPAQVFLEGFLRLVPGIIGKMESVEEDSFSGPFLDHPEYGLPTTWHNQTIPEIVQSGNHAAIKQWRRTEAAKKTMLKRFDWFVSQRPNTQALTLALQAIPPHYVALMHTQVLLKDGSIGTTSVTSIDLHDTARSCRMYNIKNFFIVTPLIDQQRIIKMFLDFWNSDTGRKYNESRYSAVRRVITTHQLDDIIQQITALEGKKPLVIATSAREHQHSTKIDYYSQGAVWQHDRPVLFLFGTGHGLDPALTSQCDFLLDPVTSMTDYNHLSVRSAIAIVLDRWLGLKGKR